jgi:hypothetical protein
VRTSCQTTSSTNESNVAVPASVPKRGDTLIFPAWRRVKINSVSEGMVWVSGHDLIPVGDLVPSGKPDTWVYQGDTRAGK